jgi:hypothetical protein
LAYLIISLKSYCELGLEISLIKLNIYNLANLESIFGEIALALIQMLINFDFMLYLAIKGVPVGVSESIKAISSFNITQTCASSFKCSVIISSIFNITPFSNLTPLATPFYNKIISFRGRKRVDCKLNNEISKGNMN